MNDETKDGLVEVFWMACLFAILSVLVLLGCAMDGVPTS